MCKSLYTYSTICFAFEKPRWLLHNTADRAETVFSHLKRNEVEFKSKGNGKQFKHQQQVLDCLTDAQYSLANSKYEKAKRAIEGGLRQRVGFF